MNSQLLYSYIRHLQAELELRNTALKREHIAYNKLKRIEDVCASVPCDWTIVGTDKIHDNVLSLIGSVKPSGTDISTNILAYTTNKGIRFLRNCE